MKHKAVLIGITSGLLLATAAHAAQLDASKFNETEVQLIDQSKPDSNGKTFAAGTILNAPLAKVCATIQAYEDYPSFMPNTAKAKVTRQPDESALVDFTLNLPLGKVKKYRLKMTPKVSPVTCHLSWKLQPWEGLKQEETIADTSGYWELSALTSNPGKTVVRYQVFTDPGPVPMGLGWIVDSMSKDSIPKMMDALRNKLR
ncbi:SRPBCC family protein [Undibacterium pigrum]|uniref:Polyketide cyclase/dehydrase/lipid transport protein n=1 Tax=Undibacterium pigrum TaxID=401470 RepID=A0A318J7S1_9BURK|nr:SRPBCC family protein [Undibacterium pigrum]PXX43183.1 polyketide cyclase/dehydrase/lipid transport protein [Undibacterium pigrum]